MLCSVETPLFSFFLSRKLTGIPGFLEAAIDLLLWRERHKKRTCVKSVDSWHVFDSHDFLKKRDTAPAEITTQESKTFFSSLRRQEIDVRKRQKHSLITGRRISGKPLSANTPYSLMQTREVVQNLSRKRQGFQLKTIDFIRKEWWTRRKDTRVESHYSSWQ